MKNLTFILFIFFSVQVYADQVSDVAKHAEQGDKQSQFFMGLWYDTGTNFEKDQEKAVKWYSLAAEQGSAGAQNNLALLYANGLGVPRNYLLAHMWSNYALGNGVEEAAELVVSLESDMSPEQIEKAREMLQQKISNDALFLLITPEIKH